MATKKKAGKGNGNGDGGGHDDAVVSALTRILEELRTHTHRFDRLEAELRATREESHAMRDILVKAQMTDRHRVDALETRVAALEAGKH